MRYFVVVLCLLLVGCTKEPPAYESKYTDPPSAAGVSSVAHPPFDIASVDVGLSGTEPYVITVLGDSTGNGKDEWVYGIAQKIAVDYSRAVTVHDWSPDSSSYTTETTVGTGAPVTVWNGSASGRDAQYSADQFSVMAPEPSNLTIISHGHNHPQTAVDGIRTLVDMSYKAGTGGVVVIAQNPIASTSISGGSDRAELEASTFRKIVSTFNDPSSGTAVIDVFGAFPAEPALSGLLRAGDGVHPNEQGQAVWTSTVATGLHLR